MLESSGSNAVFTVVLSPSNSVPVSVDYPTVDGTATAGQDYQAVSGTLVFAPGMTNLTVSVPVLDDALAEVPSSDVSLERRHLTHTRPQETGPSNKMAALLRDAATG